MSNLNKEATNVVVGLLNLVGNADLRVRGNAMGAANQTIEEAKAFVQGLTSNKIVVEAVPTAEQETNEGDVDETENG